MELGDLYMSAWAAAWRRAQGEGWNGRHPDEHPTFLQDWPFQRPDWWLPDPAMAEAYRACKDLPEDQHPDWGRWVPSYVPGRPWPWRSEDPA